MKLELIIDKEILAISESDEDIIAQWNNFKSQVDNILNNGLYENDTLINTINNKNFKGWNVYEKF